MVATGKSANMDKPTGLKENKILKTASRGLTPRAHEEDVGTSLPNKSSGIFIRYGAEWRGTDPGAFVILSWFENNWEKNVAYSKKFFYRYYVLFSADSFVEHDSRKRSNCGSANPR